MGEFLQALLSLTLFGSIFWGITIFVIFIIFCFISDVNENGFIATISLIGMSLLFYFYGKESWHTLLSLLTAKFFIFYFSFGLIHAFIRVYFHGRSEMKKVNEYRLEGHTYEYNIERKIKNNIFRWWFLFPISLIDWVISDMIKEIYDWIYQKMSKIFDYVFELGMKSIKEVPKPEKRNK